ncbi:MAG: glutaminyl-peptide cyclotransferase [Nitrospira sp.]|nr:glutaminyl-peptide cyclotransferase [Nitrospira sp.]
MKTTYILITALLYLGMPFISHAIEGSDYLQFKIINTYPHDPEAFTQGLVYEDGLLYESTGRYGYSSLRKTDIQSGRILNIHHLPPQLFGEGTVIYNDRIIQLTWKQGVGFIYDKKGLNLNSSFNYATEGWGITHDDSRLIMSDGTDTLYFLSPESYKKIGSIKVSYKQQPVNNLNELEYIKGRIYANVWRTNNIAVINPETGHIEAWLNLEKLTRLAGGDTASKTLNGIAYDQKNDRIFVTGKLWPYIYEIKVFTHEKLPE